MKKSRIVSLTLAGAVSVAALFAGTYAWRSVTQNVTNQVLGSLNPGGRLHDDFNGMNIADGDTKVKKVYVENFTTDGAQIYARIKFYEYLEKGEGAGKATGSGKAAVSIVADKNIEEEENWTPYQWNDTGSVFRKYVKLNLGGETKYLPTYNMDKDSLEADANGTLAGSDGTGEHAYDDYTDYAAHNIGDPKYGVEIYALDDQGVDEVHQANLIAQEIIDAIMDTGSGTIKVSQADQTLTIGDYENVPIRVVENDASRVTEVYLDLLDEAGVQGSDGVEEIKVVVPAEDQMHKVAQTLTAADAVKMADWIEAGLTPGNFWVLDEDGWAYWANPINSGEATGCLLNSISLVDGADIDGEFYYALNVVAQFATAGDWNTNVEGAGFKAGDITANAVALLNKISTSTAGAPEP